MTADASCCVPGGDGILRDDLSEIPLRLATSGFSALWHRGRAIEAAELFPGEEDVVTETLAALHERGRAEVDGDGRLVGIHGLTLERTRHSFDHGGVIRHTWCAFDSVGIPATLGLTATARTDCPTCGRPISVHVRAGLVDEDGPLLWLLRPQSTSHLMNDFCSVADLYCSLEHLEQRIDRREMVGRVASLREAVTLGCETWDDVARSDLSATRAAR